MTQASQARMITPSERERRYDRQLRLWAARGQTALESAHVVLVNSGRGIVGIETLKNLILPGIRTLYDHAFALAKVRITYPSIGIGRFTIIDQARTTEADLGANFFLEQNDLGKSRAASCVNILSELNPDAQGDWYPKDEEALDLKSLLEKLPPITVILYALPIAQDFSSAIHQFKARHMTPIVSLYSTGFYSYFRIDYPQIFPIIDTHPEPSAAIDLRLLKPWPELSQFASDLAHDIDNLNDHDHGHLPYVIIILHYLSIWANEHFGKYPSSSREKIELRGLIEAGMRRDVPGNIEENFQEAATMLRRVVADTELPPSVQDLFKQSVVYQVTAKDDGRFWAICQAVSRFFDIHKALPLPGNLPDMKAESNIYVKIQHIYKQKARDDAEEVFKLVPELPSGAAVELEDVELFCRNAAFMRVITPSKSPQEKLGQLAECMFEEDGLGEATGLSSSIFAIYAALHASSQVMKTPSLEEIHTVLDEMFTGASHKKVLEAAKEVSRATGNELHIVSAFTGGLVGQELIKIITQQYVPIDNTCIFDGINSRCQVLRI